MNRVVALRLSAPLYTALRPSLTAPLLYSSIVRYQINHNSISARPSPQFTLFDDVKPNSTPRGRLRRDEEISHTHVTFIDEEGKLFSNVSVQQILRSIDRSAYFLIEVDPNAQPQPVCRAIAKKLLFDKQKASKNKKKNTFSPEQVLKEIQFGWNVAEHDVKHKLNHARQFLERGNKVNIVISSKKGAPKVTNEAQMTLIGKVKDELSSFASLVKGPMLNNEQALLMFEMREPVGGKVKANGVEEEG
ncbi:translation initiation factor IF-3, C-terminal domain-containing protein [Endogone sp. FLAS-F59071]|nr:translation initiation factor IF-3, C-terminal domain-containing protein [Endogone sp. FLAS-F59071]|eukprot:RUS22323.1 translation initiation factor IF-3, C-terminal domain-containing protein [Endogone sp. FLAS-F59071]